MFLFFFFLFSLRVLELLSVTVLSYLAAQNFVNISMLFYFIRKGKEKRKENEKNKIIIIIILCFISKIMRYWLVS